MAGNPAPVPPPAWPIPEDYWRELVAFLATEKNGQVVFHVVRGQIIGIDTIAMRRDRDRVAAV